jgi:hypothetical protein
VALLCGSRYNWIIIPGIGCQNGSKKAKYEKIFYGLRSRMFSQEVGDFTWRWEGVMEASKINVHKNSSKIYFFINKYLRFFLKKLWAWIRIRIQHSLDPVPQQWLLEKKIEKHRKTYLKNSFRGITLYVVPIGRKLSNHGFFLRKQNSRFVATAKGDPTNYFI